MANDATQANNKRSYLDKLLSDLKHCKPASGSFVRDTKILEKVKDFEMQHGGNPPTPSIAATKGEDIGRLALLDGLTELCNYRAFLKELKAEISRSGRYKHFVSLCMVTIDNFELIAKQYGYLTSDAVLKVIANVIRESVREVDIPAKYDTSSFVIVLPQTNASGAALVAERIRQRIGNQVITYNGQNFSVTASIGVASYPAQAELYDELIARATEALEHAVSRGGDRVLCI